MSRVELDQYCVVVLKDWFRMSRSALDIASTSHLLVYSTKRFKPNLNLNSPLEEFYKNLALKNVAKSIKKHFCQSIFFFNDAASLQTANLSKKCLRHRYFLEIFAKNENKTRKTSVN